MHVFGRWEEAGGPGENPHKHFENMQPPHRKAPAGIWTRNPLAVKCIRTNGGNAHNIIRHKTVLKLCLWKAKRQLSQSPQTLSLAWIKKMWKTYFAIHCTNKFSKRAMLSSQELLKSKEKRAKWITVTCHLNFNFQICSNKLIDIF